MNEVLSGDIEEIEETIGRMEKDKPSLKPIADAFRELLVSRARIKARIPDYQGPPLPSPDLNRHFEGIPLLTQESLADLMDPWGEIVASTIAPLARAFPRIEAEAQRLKHAFDTGEADLSQCMRALVKGDGDEMDRIASRLGFPPSVLAFLLSQMLKPFVEKRAEPLHALVGKLPWHRGYCPICGSFPEITYLQGEGQRWLRCSWCGHEWQFDRMLCPRCENLEQKRKDLIFVEGRRHEYAEACPDCHRYTVGIDLRERKGESITPASAIGLVHLDIMAQEKGYSPLAVCAWNMVGDT